jgi:UDPglucose 6-dehydrogenase
MEIVFANAVYEMTNLLGANYQNVFDAVSKRKNINTSYLKCSNQYKGFGGVCLPKDSMAWAILAKELNVKVELFDAIINDNRRYL